MSHVRRRSSRAALGTPSDPTLPSPYLPQSKTPRLGGNDKGQFNGARPDGSVGLGLGQYRGTERRPLRDGASSSNLDTKAALSRLANVLFRVVRTPRGIVTLSTLFLVWLTTSYVRKNSHHLATRPVHPALLPIIRHSGNAIHYLSPNLGSKVKSWHDYQVQSNPNRPLTAEEVEARSQHTFHPNGLMLVNPRGRHPINVLIERAEKQWKEKVARQSRTLSEAVREYKQRYRRNPPKGFDDWCVPSLLPLSRSVRFADFDCAFSGGTFARRTTSSFATSMTRSTTTSRLTGLCAFSPSSRFLFRSY